MMPLTMRRSSSRSGPVNPLGRCGSIRAHCLSFSQNKPARILSPPNQHVGKRITRRYLGTDPRSGLFICFTEVTSIRLAQVYLYLLNDLRNERSRVFCPKGGSKSF